MKTARKQNTLDVIVNHSADYAIIVINDERPLLVEYPAHWDDQNHPVKTEQVLNWIRDRSVAFILCFENVDFSLPFEFTMGDFSRTSRPLTLTTNGRPDQWTLTPTAE